MNTFIRIIGISLFFISSCFAQELTLENCNSLALKHNKTLKEGQWKVKNAELKKEEAYTHYFPKVDAGATAFKASKNFLELETPEMNLPIYDGNKANLANSTQFAFIPSMNIGMLDYSNMAHITAIQPVYTGGQLKNANKLATVGIAIANKQLVLSEHSVLLKTASFYWTIVDLKEKMKTLLKYEIMINTLLEDVSVSFDAGLILQSDVLKVTLKKNEITNQKLQLGNATAMLTRALCQHIGKEYTNTIQLTSLQAPLKAPLSYHKNADERVYKRNEYQLLGAVKKAAELQLDLVKGKLMPQLAVGISALYIDVLDQQNGNFMAFASLNVPISDWWAGGKKLKQQQYKIAIAANKQAETSELLNLEIIQKYNKLEETYQQIDIANIGVSQANAHYKVINDNYKAGLINTSDLLEAQALLQETNNTKTTALCNYKLSLLQYQIAINDYQTP